MKKKNNKEKFLTFKLLVAIIYLIIITILFVCSYNLFKERNNIVPWSEVTSTSDYTYINVSKMSEKFAYYKDTNVGIHFVIEKEDTGLWHTYLIAIDENQYDDYKEIIDYTYGRIKEEPEAMKVYGYPVLVNDQIKNLAIKNIPSFVPESNEVTITKENYNQYLTNSYLDTTKPQHDKISIVLFIVLFVLFMTIILFIDNIFLKENIKNKRKRAILWNFKK